MYQRNATVEFCNEEQYQNALLQCIGGSLDDWDEAICHILKVTEDCAMMTALCEDAAKKHLHVEDRYSGIIVLMSYDYLDLFHECMQLLLEQGCGAVESSASAKALKGRIHALRVVSTV